MKFSFIKSSHELDYGFVFKPSLFCDGREFDISKAKFKAERMGYNSKSPLLGYQKRWIKDKSKFKVAEKGRRTGFTWGEAADASLTASLSRAAGGSDHFYIGSNREMAEEFIDAVAGWAQVYSYACGAIEESEVDRDGKYFEDKDGNKINTFTIYFESGYKVHALSSRPSNLRGRQGNVTIDEGGFHDDLKAVLQAAVPLMGWGGKIRIISTHNTINSHYYEIVEDVKKGVRKGTLHKLTLDEARADGLVKRICQVKGIKWTPEFEDEWTNDIVGVLDEDSVKEEFYCVPKESGGSYMELFILTRAAKPQHRVIRYTAPKHFMSLSEDERRKSMNEWLENTLSPYFKALNIEERHALGEDFARTGDLTVFTITAIQKNTKRPQRLVIELKNVPYNQQREALFWIGHRLPRLTGMALDATGNGGYLAEQAVIEFGSSIVQAVHLTNKVYEEWMPKYKASFEDETSEIPLDDEVIQDHRAIEVINGVPKVDKGKTKSARGGYRHGDSGISGMLSYMASQMEGGVIEFTALNNHNSDWSTNDSDWDDDGYEKGCF